MTSRLSSGPKSPDALAVWDGDAILSRSGTLLPFLLLVVGRPWPSIPALPTIKRVLGTRVRDLK
ncbi:hypothetical protein [Homoserinimonas sp. OAct 916]|uniref:hypothetical protein n=1 Tax=Homoserinimonas sp. OAct 916 TaxID=2211450 RepID=UPI00130037EE|nr:hypothetical protein [Homoserinimonas sp. OAct 916]